MKNLIASLLILSTVSIYAQDSRLIAYTEDGENFFLFVNGQKFNEEPQSRVVADGLNMEFAQLKIKFEAPGAPELKSPLMVEPGTQYTAVIRKNKKGKYVLRMVDMSDLETTEENETVPVEEATRPAPATENSQTVTTTTTTTSQPTANTGESVGINLSVGDESMNVSVSFSESDVSEETTVTTTSTTTTTTSEPASQPVNTCPEMTGSSYNRAIQSIAGKAFEDEKLTVFKQVINNNCVSVSQVVGFMNEFTYEEEKLEVAKRAYPKTVDKGNYYQVNDALTYSDSIEQLNRFLESQK